MHTFSPYNTGYHLVLTINSLSGTLHLGYGWDPRTKVIACTTRVMCAKEFVIERYIFHIIANMGFWFLVMTRQALLMSPKGRNAPRDGLVKLWEGGRLLLFAIPLLCEITRHSYEHAYKARRLPL